MNCSKCRRVLEDDWSACPFCGTRTGSGQGGLNEQEDQGTLVAVASPWVSMDGTGSGQGTSKESDRISQHGSSGEPTMWGLQSGVKLDRGTRMGQFEIRGELGHGAFGDVYKAYDDVRHVEVALKVVFPELANADSAFRQLVHESDVRDRIKDLSNVLPASTPIRAEYQGLAAILLSMPLAEKTFRDVLKTRPQGNDAQKQWLKDGLDYFKQTCNGLGAIHQAGLTHLDVKPENILLCPENGKLVVKVTDFGLARTSGLAEDGRRGVGTPAYMAPEQFDGRPKDMGPDADVYALGCILFEIFDGSVPFEAGSIEEFKQMHLARKPPMHRWQDVSPAFQMIISKCLEKQPQARYTTATTLLKDIRRAELGMSLSMDVSCPSCRHLNEDPWTVVCENNECRANLTTLFHPCPQCARDVRLDQDFCKCRFNVADYYLLQQRWKTIQRLKEEDLAETIELLELILHDGGGDYKDQAAALVRDLRTKHRDVSVLVRDAGAAEVGGQFTVALQKWRDILKAVPHHRNGLVKIRELERRLDLASGTRDSASTVMAEGRFKEAEELLNKALEEMPGQVDLTAMLGDCRKRRVSYENALKAARDAYAQKEINRALDQVDVALTQAAKGSEAVNLQMELTKVKNRSASLVNGAQQALEQAEFSYVERCLDDIKNGQDDCAEVLSLQRALAETRPGYERVMKEAQESLRNKALDKANAAFDRALNICAESPEAKGVKAKIEKDIKRVHEAITNAEKARVAATFDVCEAKLREAEDLWPEAKELRGCHVKLQQTRNEYERLMKQARAAEAGRDLDAAHQAVKSALAECPSSQDAIRLEASITSDKSKVDNLLANAGTACTQAEFDMGRRQVQEAASLWATAKRVAEEKAKLESTEKDYTAWMNEANAALKRKKFDVSADALGRAWSLCPQSAALRNLARAIRAAAEAEEDKQAEAKRRRQEARQLTGKMGKWMGIAIATGLVVLIVGAGLYLGWQWVQTTGWPWADAHKQNILWFVLGGVAFASITHFCRYTNFYRFVFHDIFEMRSDSPLVALLVVCLILSMVVAAPSVAAYFICKTWIELLGQDCLVIAYLVAAFVSVVEIIVALTTKCMYSRA